MKTLLILLFSMVMAGEMTVDGNLTVADTLQVTTIQSATIDSLLSLIAQLEMRIAQLESQMALMGYADCNGVIGGDAVLDLCDICDGNNESMDVCGTCGGDIENVDNCYTVFDADGNGYHAIQIGSQRWLKKSAN